MPFDFFMARARREKLPKASTRPEAPAAAEGVYGIITCKTERPSVDEIIDDK